MNPTPVYEIVQQAEQELREERRRNAIEREKDRLRARAARPWWARIFPWRIKIERKL